MTELTLEQRQELVRAGQPRLVDPDTKKVYVLISEELYQRVKGLLDADFQPSEAYPLLDRAFADDWNDPKMADYDRYEELKR